jgi:hypothetical protein
LLAAVAEDTLALPVVDDAHWTEPASGRALSFRLWRLLADRALTVLTRRVAEEGWAAACSARRAGRRPVAARSPAQGGHHGAVGRADPRPRCASPEHRQLMTQDDDLDLSINDASGADSDGGRRASATECGRAAGSTSRTVGVENAVTSCDLHMPRALMTNGEALF